MVKRLLVLLILFPICKYFAQSTYNYSQRVADYYSTFTDGGGDFDQGSTQVGMWANTGNTKVAAWRKFKDGSGTARSLAIGDKFIIAVSACRAYGNIGFALLATPSTGSYANRISNFALNVYMDGPGYTGNGTWAPWKIQGTSTSSASSGGFEGTYHDFIFTVTLTAANKANIIITDNSSQILNVNDFTLNSSSAITDFSIYLDNDWDNSAHKNVYWGLSGSANTSVTTAYTSTGATDWNTGSTWTGGSVPAASSTVVVNHAVTVNSAVTNAQSLLIINSGQSLAFGASGTLTASVIKNNGTVNMTSGGTLTVASGGTFTNNSTLTAGAGTFSFSGTGTVTGTCAFNNATIYGGVDFGSSSTVSGTLKVGTGGYLSGSVPSGFFGSLSTVMFDQGSGATYDVGALDVTWSGSNPPKNVTVNSGTVNLNSARTLLGNLNISGGTLNLTANLTINGDWTRTSGTFTPNTNTVEFTGSANSTINTTASFYRLKVNKSTGFKLLIADGTTATVTNTLDLTSGSLEKAGTTGALTLSNSATINRSGGTGVAGISPTFGTGHTVNYSGASALTTANELPAGNGATINVTNTAGLTLNQNITSGTLNVNSSGVLDFGTYTFAGTAFTLNTGEIKTAKSTGITGTLTSGTLTFTAGTITLNGTAQNVGRGSNTISAITLKTSGSGTTTLDADATVGSLNIGTGTTFDCSSRTLSVSSAGTFTNGGTFTRGTGAVSFLGTGTVSGTVGFNNVTIAGGVNFGTASTINGTLQINSGGWVNTNAVTYATGSTLKYNGVSAYGVSTEWTAGTSSGAGVPYHVSLAGSTVTFGSSASYRQVLGNLTIDGTSGLTLSGTAGGDLSVAGDWTRASGGTYNANSREVSFNGTTDQTITSTGSVLTQPWMAISKSSGNIIVASNLEITNRFRFSSGNAGKITTNNSSTFKINNTAADDNGSNGIKYDGSVAQGWFYGISVIRAHGTTAGSYLFPVGSSTDYRGATVNFTSAPAANSDLTCQFSTTNPLAGTGNAGLPGGLTGYWAGGYWTIDTSGTTGGAYTMSVNTSGITGVAGDTRIMKRTSFTAAWNLAGTGHSYASPNLNETTIYGFGQYGLGGTTQALPVELASFNSAVLGRAVQLDWVTATEINSAYFRVERKKAGSEIWTDLADINASLHSNAPKKYSYTDKNLNSGSYQYRLKMVDNDGSYEYSDIINAVIEVPKEFRLSQNYPNPFNPSTRINYTLKEESRVMLELFSVTGVKIATLINESAPAGYYDFELNMMQYRLSAGMYIYRLTARENATGEALTDVKKMIYLK